MEWKKLFEGVPDFRLDRKKLHKLGDILMLSFCAVLSGAEDFEDMENYGRQKEDFLRQFLELPNGNPSHDTINRVYNRLDKDKFGKSLYRWVLWSFISSIWTEKFLEAQERQVESIQEYVW